MKCKHSNYFCYEFLIIRKFCSFINYSTVKLIIPNINISNLIFSSVFLFINLPLNKNIKFKYFPSLNN